MPAAKKRRYRKKASDVGRGGSGAGGDDSSESHEMDTAATGADLFSSVTSKVLHDAGAGGFFAEYSVAEKKAEERAKRRLERKRQKRKRAFEVVGGAQAEASESSGSEGSEDEQAKLRRQHDARLVRTHVLNQSHRRAVPHLEQVDYEKRLRRVATKGVVRLFNAVAMAQRQAADLEAGGGDAAAAADLPKGPVPASEEMTKSKFLEMLKRGADPGPAAKAAAKATAQTASTSGRGGKPKHKGRKRK